MNKQNLLVLIPNFGIHQTNYLNTVLSEYENYDEINVDVILFSTHNYENTFNISLTQILYDTSIGYKLSEQTRLYALDNINKYDLYMHQENDTLITQKNILSYIEGQHLLDELYGKNTYIHGFIRYEMKENDSEKYLIDMAISEKFHKVAQIKDNLLHFDNVHQGGWLINKSQLTELNSRNIRYGASLEDYCSNFYLSNKWPGTENGIHKTINKNFIDDSCIYHLPNKYVNIYKEFMTLTKLKN
jgi:hypothetical protein